MAKLYIKSDNFWPLLFELKRIHWFHSESSNRKYLCCETFFLFSTQKVVIRFSTDREISNRFGFKLRYNSKS